MQDPDPYEPVTDDASGTDANEYQERPVAGDATADVLGDLADYSSMDLSELTSKARDLHALLDNRNTKTEAMIKETRVWTRRLGQALQAAKDKLKITGGGWQKWLRGTNKMTHGIEVANISTH